MPIIVVVGGVFSPFNYFHAALVVLSHAFPICLSIVCLWNIQSNHGNCPNYRPMLTSGVDPGDFDISPQGGWPM